MCRRSSGASLGHHKHNVFVFTTTVRSLLEIAGDKLGSCCWRDAIANEWAESSSHGVAAPKRKQDKCDKRDATNQLRNQLLFSWSPSGFFNRTDGVSSMCSYEDLELKMLFSWGLKGSCFRSWFPLNEACPGPWGQLMMNRAHQSQNLNRDSDTRLISI